MFVIMHRSRNRNRNGGSWTVDRWTDSRAAAIQGMAEYKHADQKMGAEVEYLVTEVIARDATDS